MRKHHKRRSRNNHNNQTSPSNVASLSGAQSSLFKTEKKFKRPGSTSRSRGNLARQKTDEDIKKLYGIRRVNRETKHLEIMIEMSRTTAPILEEKKRGHRSTSANSTRNRSINSS